MPANTAYYGLPNPEQTLTNLTNAALQWAKFDNALARASRGGGSGVNGAPAGYKNYPNPLDPNGQPLTLPYGGSTEKERERADDVNMKRAAQAALQKMPFAADLEKEINDLPALDVNRQEQKLAEIRTKYVPAAKSLVDVMYQPYIEAAYKDKLDTVKAQIDLNKDAVKNTSRLSILGDTASMMGNRIKHGFRGLFQSAEEERKTAEELRRENTETIMKNPYLLNQLKREMAGEGILERNLTNNDWSDKLTNIATAGVEMLPLAAGTAVTALTAGAGAPVGAALAAGGALAGGLGYGTGRGAYQEQIAGSDMTPEKQVEALEKGANTAGLIQGAVDAAFGSGLAGKAFSKVTGPIAKKLLPWQRKITAAGEKAYAEAITKGATEEAAQGAKEAAINAGLADLAKRGPGSYFLDIPRNALEMGTLMSAGQMGQNLNYGHATGQDVPLMQGVPEAWEGAAVASPFLALMGQVSHIPRANAAAAKTFAEEAMKAAEKSVPQSGTSATNTNTATPPTGSASTRAERFQKMAEENKTPDAQWYENFYKNWRDDGGTFDEFNDFLKRQERAKDGMTIQQVRAARIVAKRMNMGMSANPGRATDRAASQGNIRNKILRQEQAARTIRDMYNPDPNARYEVLVDPDRVVADYVRRGGTLDELSEYLDQQEQVPFMVNRLPQEAFDRVRAAIERARPKPEPEAQPAPEGQPQPQPQPGAPAAENKPGTGPDPVVDNAANTNVTDNGTPSPQNAPTPAPSNVPPYDTHRAVLLEATAKLNDIEVNRSSTPEELEPLVEPVFDEMMKTGLVTDQDLADLSDQINWSKARINQAQGKSFVTKAFENNAIKTAIRRVIDRIRKNREKHSGETNSNEGDKADESHKAGGTGEGDTPPVPPSDARGTEGADAADNGASDKLETDTETATPSPAPGEPAQTGADNKADEVSGNGGDRLSVERQTTTPPQDNPEQSASTEGGDRRRVDTEVVPTDEEGVQGKGGPGSKETGSGSDAPSGKEGGEDEEPDGWPVTSKPTIIKFDNNQYRDLDASYIVFSAKMLNASHLPSGQRNPNYEFENTRDYSKQADWDNVLILEDIFDPDIPLDPTRKSQDGPPIIDQNFNVISGNRRTITMQRIYDKPSPKQDALRDAVRKFALDEIGIPEELFEQFDDPIIVRRINEPLSHEELQNLVDITNRPSSAPTRTDIRAASLSDNLSVDMIRQIAAGINKMKEGKTLNGFFDSGSKLSQDLMYDLINAKVLDNINHAMFDPKTNAPTMTVEGKKFLAKALANSLLRNPDGSLDIQYINNIPEDLRNKLPSVALKLAEMEGVSEAMTAKARAANPSSPSWGLRGHIENALQLSKQMVKDGVKLRKNLGLMSRRVRRKNFDQRLDAASRATPIVKSILDYLWPGATSAKLLEHMNTYRKILNDLTAKQRSLAGKQAKNYGLKTTQAFAFSPRSNVLVPMLSSPDIMEKFLAKSAIQAQLTPDLDAAIKGPATSAASMDATEKLAQKAYKTFNVQAPPIDIKSVYDAWLEQPIHDKFTFFEQAKAAQRSNNADQVVNKRNNPVCS